jgi:hypothetical protein
MDGKADGWKEIKDVIPKEMPIIAAPLSPTMKSKISLSGMILWPKQSR